MESGSKGFIITTRIGVTERVRKGIEGEYEWEIYMCVSAHIYVYVDRKDFCSYKNMYWCYVTSFNLFVVTKFLISRSLKRLLGLVQEMSFSFRA